MGPLTLALAVMAKPAALALELALARERAPAWSKKPRMRMRMRVGWLMMLICALPCVASTPEAALAATMPATVRMAIMGAIAVDEANTAAPSPLWQRCCGLRLALEHAITSSSIVLMIVMAAMVRTRTCLCLAWAANEDGTLAHACADLRCPHLRAQLGEGEDKGEAQGEGEGGQVKLRAQHHCAAARQSAAGEQRGAAAPAAGVHAHLRPWAASRPPSIARALAAAENCTVLQAHRQLLLLPTVARLMIVMHFPHQRLV